MRDMSCDYFSTKTSDMGSGVWLQGSGIGSVLGPVHPPLGGDREQGLPHKHRESSDFITSLL